jgi:hypothetical protein
MADTKISALTGATTPLAGTEVLPVVQGGATKQVSVANLTAGRAPTMSGATLRNTAPVLNFVTTAGEDITGYISNSIDVGTGGKLVFGTKRNGDTTLDRVSINAAGDMTLLTSNLVIGTSGQGIDFSATSGTGTSELLADYEEGTFTPEYTPTTGAFTSVTYLVQVGKYTKIGNAVNFTIAIRTDAITVGTASGSIRISGLPFTSSSSPNYQAATIGFSNAFVLNNPSAGIVEANATTLNLTYRATANGASSFLNVTDLATGGSANYVFLSGTYFV